jgi:catechol 2,3-dioxygenase-like lactoylglutathione lyase family enzyme
VFDHVGIRCSDFAASQRFYGTVLDALGYEAPSIGEDLAEWDDLALSPTSPGHPVTTGLHIGFAAPSRAHVDAFWRAGIAAGYADDGAPGPRPQYTPDYYGAFLRDPDGNSAEAVHAGAERTDGHVDHLWLRVADVQASRRFYAAIAPHAGFRLSTDTPQRVSFDRDGPGGGSFSVVAGSPLTHHLHVAFGGRVADVHAFHAAALEAGFASNGEPGERSYHPGYYAAFVLDPDGTNVEVVDHQRAG